MSIVRALASLRASRIRRDENGVGHRFPAAPRTMRIDDLFALAGSDQAVGQLIDTLVNTLGALAKARKVIT